MSNFVESISEKQNSTFNFMDSIRTCVHCGKEFYDLYRVCCSAKCSSEIS